MDRSQRLSGHLGNFLSCHSVEICHLDHLSLHAGQRTHRAAYLLILQDHLRLLRDIHIGVWGSVKNRDAVVAIRHHLGTNVISSIHIDRQIARNSEEPARKRTALRLKCIGTLPDAPECFLQDIFRSGAIANDLEREPKHRGIMTIIESLKRSTISSGYLSY